jgi:FtsP/CotA-like multicopper oxidase with cupredoxin domain
LLGGLSGVLIIEGMEKFFPEVAQLKERVLVLRDMDKSNPADDIYASPSEPWKNVSINSIPIRYGSKDKAPVLEMIAGAREFWRVANASADTPFILRVQFNDPASPGWKNQALELLAIDGIPFVDNSGLPLKTKLIKKQIVLPPGARAEFIVTAPAAGVAARFHTADFNTYLKPASANCASDFPNSVCDNTDRAPARTLATIQTAPALKSPLLAKRSLVQATGKLQRFANLASATPIKNRKFYFSKSLGDDGLFFITQDDPLNPVIPKAFEMTDAPLVIQGPTVEDWTIENRDNESHVFHIHQIHFKVLEENDVRMNTHILRDTVAIGACRQWAAGVDPENDPYVNDPDHKGLNCLKPATAKLRMDFRDRDVKGTFVYHCHVLEHEDNGMMGIIQLN